MQDIFNVIADFVAFPLPNVISLIFIVSAAWWFIKLRPAEQKTHSDALNGFQQELFSWRTLMQEDRTTMLEALDEIKKTQETLNKDFDNIAEKILDIVTSSAVVDERLYDIKQHMKDCTKGK